MRKAVFSVSTGPDVGKIFTLTSDRSLKMGRSPKADVVLQDPSVSRFHAEVFFEGDSFRVLDLESRSGVYLREKRVERGSLHNGDWLVLGDTVITISIQDPSRLPSIEGYRVLKKIGTGGMGTVYKARESSTGRDVALKVLPASSQPDQETTALFAREARTIGKLRHPNVVEIYDVSFSKGAHYIEMEYVDGTDILSRLRREGVFPVPETVSIAVQVSDVLVEAERKSIVHRDIKPGNLILTAGGTVKLCDFGLAKDLDDAGVHLLTKPGTARGTLDYMAPEQFTDPSSVGPKSDQYALGATLYHMLTGKPRLSGGTHNEYLMRITGEEPPPVSRAREGVPEELDATLTRMLKRDPAERFERSEAYHRAFQSIMDADKP